MDSEAVGEKMADRQPDATDGKITGDRPRKTPPEPAFSVNRP